MVQCRYLQSVRDAVGTVSFILLSQHCGDGMQRTYGVGHRPVVARASRQHMTCEALLHQDHLTCFDFTSGRQAIQIHARG